VEALRKGAEEERRREGLVVSGGGSEERSRGGEEVRRPRGLTSTVQQVLQQHQVHGAGAAGRAVALGDAEVGAAPVVTGTRV